MTILFSYTVLSVLFAPSLSVFMLEDQFTFITSGKKAKNCTLSTFVAKTRLFCMKYCLTNKDCHGMNFQRNTGKCELLSKDLDLDLLDDQEDFDLYHRKIGCKDLPCKHGTCVNGHVTLNNFRAYACKCRCGWCGRECDILNFNVVENVCIENYNAGYKKVNHVRECMIFCTDVSNCLSADYFVESNECWLNSVNDELIPYTENCNEIYNMNVMYLTPNCSCSDPK
ncbi:uncharacterized protein [Centruroides vittatus]|uniref:uncharacterized protein n=1 Tax=Centruroides vittatus TaxID=120091 RepID=UPI0035108CE8